MVEYTLVDVPAVESADDPEWGWAYQGMRNVEVKCYTQRFGDDDMAETAQYWAAERRNEKAETKYLKVAIAGTDRERHRVVGYALLALPKASNKDRGVVTWCVRPDWLAAGVGHRLIKAMEAITTSLGRSTVIVWADFGLRDDFPPYAGAPKAGLVPLEAPEVATVLAMGYEVSQVERQSMLMLPMDADVERSMRDEAAAHVGDYRVLSWTGDVPDHLVEDYAALKRRFNSLVPSGTVVWENAVWDRERVEHENQVHRDMGGTLVTTAVQSNETGGLVALTDIFVPLDLARRVCWQWLTMVLPEHRGHRLGMWIKLVNLAAMRNQFSHIQRVYTWNAEENAPMLRINIRMGFNPRGGSVEMAKSLASA